MSLQVYSLISCPFLVSVCVWGGGGGGGVAWYLFNGWSLVMDITSLCIFSHVYALNKSCTGQFHYWHRNVLCSSVTCPFEH